MHTLSLLCSMSRLPHLTVCLVGALLLMPVCRAEKDDEFESTTDDYEYVGTFEYSFFSNSSTDELDKFLEKAGDTGDVELGTDVIPTQDVTEEVEEEEEEQEYVEEVTITRPPTVRTILKDTACRTTSPSLLITLGLISHQLARLLL